MIQKLKDMGIEAVISIGGDGSQRISQKLYEKGLNIIIYLYGKKDGATTKDIMKDIWSYSDEVDTHTYETHLYRLRQKILNKLKDKKFVEIKEGKYFLNH